MADTVGSIMNTLGEQKVDESEFEITMKDTSNLWDQFRELIRSQGWTTQDEATLNLLSEQKDVLNLFVVRKSDGLLIAGLNIIDTDQHVYGNTYVTRPEFRSTGFGMTLSKMFIRELHGSLLKKPLIGREAKSITGMYTRPPWNGLYHYSMYSFTLPRDDLLKFFHVDQKSGLLAVPVNNLTPKQFEKVVAYDRYVTGLDREWFITNFFSLTFVRGAVLIDIHGDIQGMAAAVPTGGKANLFKLNPIFARNETEVAELVKAVVEQVKVPDVSYVCHVRELSVGEKLFEKARKQNVPLHFVGRLGQPTNFNTWWKDPSRRELVWAPTNSPCYFDG